MSDLNKENPKIEARLKRKEFNTLDSAIACVCFIILSILFDLVLQALGSVVGSSFVLWFSVLFLAEGIFGIAVIITAKTRKVELFTATNMKAKIDGYSVLLAGVISLICLFSFTGLTNVFMNFLYKLGYESSASLKVSNLDTYLLYIFLICVCPAVFEDMLFRGCILNGLKKLGPIKAVVISSIIFMLMHGGPDQTIHQLIIGVVLGFSLLASGSLWVPVIIHFLNNFIALTTAYVTRDVVVESTEITWGSLGLSLIYAIVSAAVGAVLVYYCIKALNKLRVNREKKENEKVLQLLDKESIDKEDVQELKESTKTLTENIQENEKLKTEKKYTIILFIAGGGYLIINWLFALISGLL